MNRIAVSVVVCVGVAAVAAGAWWHGRGTLAETRARLARVSAESALLRERLARAAVKPTPPAVRAAPSVPSSGAAAAPRAAPSSPPSIVEQDELMKDPRLQNLEIAAIRAELPRSYGAFFQAQGLTPGEIAALSDALARHEAVMKDIATVGRSRQLRSNDPALVKQRESAVAELKAETAALLGASRQEALGEYQRTVPVRAFVGDLAGGAAVAGFPLTPEQGEKVALALARSDPGYEKGGTVEMNRVAWEKADAEIRAVLSPAQWEYYARADPGRGVQSRTSRLSSTAMFDALRDYERTLQQSGR